MFPIYSERQFSQSRPETEHEYFMRMARNLRDQRSRERRAARHRPVHRPPAPQALRPGLTRLAPGRAGRRPAHIRSKLRNRSQSVTAASNERCSVRA